MFIIVSSLFFIGYYFGINGRSRKNNLELYRGDIVGGLQQPASEFSPLTFDVKSKGFEVSAATETDSILKGGIEINIFLGAYGSSSLSAAGKQAEEVVKPIVNEEANNSEHAEAVKVESVLSTDSDIYLYGPFSKGYTYEKGILYGRYRASSKSE
jgi:hypothetical protein